jgi:hypothetical protein
MISTGTQTGMRDLLMTRLSPRFRFHDFLYTRVNYSARPVELPEWEDLDQHLECGRALCRNLLEPMVDLYGPCSISSGVSPFNRGHYNVGPHAWNREFGAAADVAFHGWYDEGGSPFELLLHYDQQSGNPYERVISYACSRFVCVSWREGVNRAALMENRRLGEGRYSFIKHGSGASARAARKDALYVEVAEWEGTPGEGIPSAGRRFRPQHIQCSKWFTLLDMGKSVSSWEEGIRSVPPVRKKIVGACSLVADVLDALVEAVGQVGIIQGIAPIYWEGRREFQWHHGGEKAVQVSVPEGTEDWEVLDVWRDDDRVADVIPLDEPETFEIRIRA